MMFQLCRFLVCTTTDGVFEKGNLYPFCLLDGYAYMVVIDDVKRKPVLFSLDSYEDGTYKLVGTYNDWENAVFREVKP